MKTIQLHFPDELAKRLRSIPMDIEKFIIDSVQKNLRETENIKMEKLLIEGYTASKKESKKITKEFESVDLENWNEY